MIDWQRVASLKDEIGEEDFAEVVPLFLDEVASTADMLRSEPDLSRLEEDLHFLKGSALNLGFEQFSALCHAGEQAAASGNASDVDIDEILGCFEDSKTAFEAGLENGLAN